MDKGKCKTVIVLDTETTPIVKMGDVVDAHKMRVYDMGYIVRDKYTGEVYAERSFVCTDIFFSGRQYMDNAYYTDKLPQYYAGIATGGEWMPVSFAKFGRTIANLIKQRWMPHARTFRRAWWIHLPIYDGAISGGMPNASLALSVIVSGLQFTGTSQPRVHPAQALNTLSSTSTVIPRLPNATRH